MRELRRAMDETKRQLMCEVTEQNKMVDSLTKEKTCKSFWRLILLFSSYEKVTEELTNRDLRDPFLILFK